MRFEAWQEEALFDHCLLLSIQTEEATAAETARRCFDAWAAYHENGTRIRWKVRDGAIGAVVAERGRLADLVLLQRHGKKGAARDEAFEGAVLGAGRLAMVVDGALPANHLDPVMIAWNHSTEASHAIALAMPFLREARRVSIFAVGEDGEPARDLPQLRDYLALHGVIAEEAPLHTDTPVGECLTAAIAESAERAGRAGFTGALSGTAASKSDGLSASADGRRNLHIAPFS